jgi:hypothetical protein
MGRLSMGVGIILFLIVLNLLLAFIQTGVASGTGFDNPCEGQNATQCGSEAASQSDFFDALFSVSVAAQPFGPDAPTVINLLAFIIMLTALSMAVLLIITSFIPTLSE